MQLKTDSIPLKAWIYVFLMLLFFQITVYYYYKHNERTNQELAASQSIEIALDHLKTAKEKQIKMVIIGSSLVGHGVDCQEKIQEEFDEGEQAPIHITKVWLGNDPYTTFIEKNKLIQKLIAIRPDIICFQTELLTINFNPTTGFKDKLTSISMYNKMALYFLLENIGIKKSNTQKSEQCLVFNKVVKIDTVNHEPQKRSIKKLDEISFAFDDLRMLQHAGIKTVIIDIPRPLDAEKKIVSPHFKTELQKLLDLYKDNFGMEYWKYAGRSMYYSDFIDHGHLNKNGRGYYTQWLLSKIQKERLN